MSKNKWYWLIGALIIILSIVIVIPNAKRNDEVNSKVGEVIKLGLIGPLSGENSLYGIDPKKGALLAIEEINSTGGVNGHLLELIAEDSEGSPEKAISAFNKLINVNQVDYLVGGMFSSVTLAISPVAEDNEIVVVSPVSTNYKISDAGDYIFRTVPSDALQGKKGAELAFQAGYRRAAVFYIGDNDYGEGLKKVFQETFEGLGGEVVIVESHLSGDKDFKTQLLKIKSKNPDVLYLPTHTSEAGLITKQTAELGFDIQIIGTETMKDEQYISVAGGSSVGVVCTSFSESKGEVAANFLMNYQNKYNEDEKGIYSDYAYDAVYAIVRAMEKCKEINTECVRNNLYKINFEGATGSVSFDSNGDVEGKDFTVFKVQNGNFIEIK